MKYVKNLLTLGLMLLLLAVLPVNAEAAVSTSAFAPYGVTLESVISTCNDRGHILWTASEGLKQGQVTINSVTVEQNRMSFHYDLSFDCPQCQVTHEASGTAQAGYNCQAEFESLSYYDESFCISYSKEKLDHATRYQGGSIRNQHIKECTRCGVYEYHPCESEDPNVTCYSAVPCALCGSPYTSPHDIDTGKWYWDAARNSHYHQCKVSGCGGREDERFCEYGEATCEQGSSCTTCGHESGPKLEHNYTYELDSSGSSITESCDQGCGHEATAMLAVIGSCTYTGKAVEPAVLVYIDQWKGSSANIGTVTYENNTSIGASTAKVTVEGKTLRRTFDVVPALLKDVSVSQKAIPVYTGNPFPLNVDATATSVDGAAVTFRYSTVQDGTYGSSIDTVDAGEYTIYYKATAANHETATGSFICKIAKAEGSATVTQEGWVYGETPKTPVVTTSTNTGAAVTYSYKTAGAADSTYTTTVPVNAGSYMVKAEVAATTNYAAVSATATFTIARSQYVLTAADFVFTAPDSLVYDGTEKEAKVEVQSGLTGVGDITVKYDATPKNAGSYKVSIDVAQGQNYEAVSGLKSDDWGFTIDKAQPVISWDTKEFTYNGAPQGEAKVTLVIGDTCTVTYRHKLANESSDWADGLPTDVQDYIIEATVAESGNYKKVTVTNDQIQIKPLAITPTVVLETNTYICDGEYKEPAVKVLDGETEVPAGEYDVTYEHNLTVGVATVTVTDKAKGNYTVGTTSVDFLILPDESELEGIDETNVTSAHQTAIDTIQALMSASLPDDDLPGAAQWKALEARCTDLEDRISEVAAAAQKITDDTAALTDVKTDHLEEIQQLQALYDSIDDNLTEAEKQAVSDELAKLDDLEEAIEETNDALADLKAAVEALEEDELVFEDKAKIESLAEDAAALESNTYLTAAQKALLDDLADTLDELPKEFAAAEAAEALLKAMPAYAEPDNDSAIDKYFAAKDAYDKLSAEDKARVDPNAVARLAKLKKALSDYTIIKGNKSKWIKGSDIGLSFTADGHFDYFSSVEVDGTVLDSDLYNVKPGSTKVHLHTTLLKKLKPGNHIIAIYYAGEFEGVAVGTFRVQRSASSPETGDNSNVWLMSGIAVSSALALAALAAYDRKRKQQ